MTDPWTSKDTLNVFIGIITAIFTAFVYEMITNWREKNELRRTYSFLQSRESRFDWQHWDVTNGQIANFPIAGYMMLKYEGDKRFSFKWKEPDFVEVQGDGFFFWDEVFQGKMSFHRYRSNEFNYRNVFYNKIEHLGKSYDAIFVNADDQKEKRYVMLRKRN